MIDRQLLAPVLALVAWTLLIWVYMYLTRIPAIVRARIKLDPYAPRGEQMAQLPAQVRWKADNYNHLLEQPVLFYALLLVLALLGKQSAWVHGWAWAYVVLRIIHSLWQTHFNVIVVRFALFVLSNVPLFALTILAALQLFN